MTATKKGQTVRIELGRDNYAVYRNMTVTDIQTDEEGYAYGSIRMATRDIPVVTWSINCNDWLGQ